MTTLDRGENEWDVPSDDDEDNAGDGSQDVLPCPSCGAAIYEDTEKCPRCGDWVTPLSRATGRRHWIWIAAALLAIGGMLMVTVL